MSTKITRSILLIFGMFVIMLTACSMTASRPSGMVNGTPAPVKKVLGAFYPIEGTHYQLASAGAVLCFARAIGELRRHDHPSCRTCRARRGPCRR